MTAGLGPASACPFLSALPAEEAASLERRIAEFDPFGEAYQRDPAAAVAWSRAERPVFYSADLGYWVVTRYDDVKAIFRDNVTFSPSVALEKITPPSAEAMAILDSYDYAMARTLVNEDEPAHMPRRRALMEPFTPAALAHHEDMVRRLTREYVDRFIDDGRADLVDQMLWEVPLTVALTFLGVPEDDMPTLREYSVAHTVNTWGRPAPEQQAAVAESVGKFWRFSGDVLERLRADPSGPGWMPYGVRQNAVMPEVVTDSYLHSIMMAGIVAAHETTANAAANAIKLLLENRDSWDDICADPTLIPNAVEECLRHSGSIAAWRRITTADTVIDGVDIPAGARLLIMSSSANRDERHFDDPDTVDIRRMNAGEHLTFGFGAHQCMGKNLARMELQVFLEELTARLPHLALAPDQEFTYVPNTSFRGPEHLWVTWDPSRNPERTDPSVRERRTPVRIGEPSSKLISHRMVVAEREPVGDDVVRLRLEPLGGRPAPAWTAGSHIDLDCGGLSRQYSLCGDPADGGLEIAVLRERDGRGGSTFVHESLLVGTEVRVRGPRNHFRLDPDVHRHVFVAGGIGITPISALAAEARRRGDVFELHYAGRSRRTMAFAALLRERFGDRVHLYPADEGRRLDLNALLEDPAPDTRVYACGPARLLEAVTAATAAWPIGSLRVEHFAAATTLRDPASESAFEVDLTESGLTLTVPRDRTLLQTLRAANIDVQSDCEEGLCGACEVRVVAGSVDHRDLVLSEGERRSGETMMTCCSRARGPRLSIAL